MDSKVQSWLLLACLIVYLILAIVTEWFYWKSNEKIVAFYYTITLRSAEVALVLAIIASLIQMIIQIFCMCKGRPLFPSCQRKRMMIVILSTGLVQMVQGTTGAVDSLQSYLNIHAGDYRVNLAFFTWTSLTASMVYMMSSNLTVLLATATSLSMDDTTDVERGNNIHSLSHAGRCHLLPSGHLWSLIYRAIQLAFAMWSLFAMVSASKKKDTFTFIFLVRLLKCKCIWIGPLLALEGLSTVWDSASHLLQKRWFNVVIFFGDMVVVGLLLRVACGATSIVALIYEDVDCYKNNCGLFVNPITLAFASYITLFVPSINKMLVWLNS